LTLKAECKNKYGGERAICPKCKKPNSELYQFLKEDTRDLECSECHELSYYGAYFPETFEKAKKEYMESLGL